MRVSYAALALPVLASAQSDALIKAINQTVKDVTALNSTLTGIPINTKDFGLTVFQLLSGSQALAADVGNATLAANNAQQLNTQESTDVFNAVFALVPPVVQLLDNFVNHCAAFANAGLQPTVAQQLAGQVKTVGEETTAIAKKLTAPYNGYVSTGSVFLTRAFAQTYNLFNGPLCNATTSCAPFILASGAAAGASNSTTGGTTGGSTGGSSPSGSSGAGTGGSTTAKPSGTGAGGFTAQSIPTTFTGAAVLNKRSPFGTFLNVL